MRAAIVARGWFQSRSVLQMPHILQESFPVTCVSAADEKITRAPVVVQAQCVAAGVGYDDLPFACTEVPLPDRSSYSRDTECHGKNKNAKADTQRTHESGSGVTGRVVNEYYKFIPHSLCMIRLYMRVARCSSISKLITGKLNTSPEHGTCRCGRQHSYSRVTSSTGIKRMRPYLLGVQDRPPNLMSKKIAYV